MKCIYPKYKSNSVIINCKDILTLDKTITGFICTILEMKEKLEGGGIGDEDC